MRDWTFELLNMLQRVEVLASTVICSTSPQFRGTRAETAADRQKLSEALKDARALSAAVYKARQSPDWPKLTGLHICAIAKATNP